MGFLENFAVKRWMKKLGKAKTHHDRLRYRMKLMGLGAKLMTYMEQYANSPEIEHRKAAVGVLKEIPTQHSKKLLLDRVKNDSSDSVRYKAAEGLAKFKGDDTIEALVSALADRSDHVRLCACHALEALVGMNPARQSSQKASSMRAGNLVVDADELQKQVNVWIEWWQERHRAGLDAAELVAATEEKPETANGGAEAKTPPKPGPKEASQPKPEARKAKPAKPAPQKLKEAPVEEHKPA